MKKGLEQEEEEERLPLLCYCPSQTKTQLWMLHGQAIKIETKSV